MYILREGLVAGLANLFYTVDLRVSTLPLRNPPSDDVGGMLMSQTRSSIPTLRFYPRSASPFVLLGFRSVGVRNFWGVLDDRWNIINLQTCVWRP